MNKRIYLILITLIIGLPLYSAEDETAQRHNFLGLAASTVSGTGLSYSRLFGADYLLKASGMYYENREEKTNPLNAAERDFNTTRWWDAGGELQKNIFSASKEGTSINFYLLAGGSYWHEKKDRPFSAEDNGTFKYYTAGTGAGVRLIIAGRFSLNMDITYQYTDRLGNKEKYTGFGGGFGVNFLF